MQILICINFLNAYDVLKLLACIRDAKPDVFLMKTNSISKPYMVYILQNNILTVLSYYDDPLLT